MSGVGAGAAGLFRRSSRDDALLLALALGQGGLFLLLPAAPVIALGIWWCSNTVSHNFIHQPFFRSRALNALFSLYLSVLLGIPQTIWRGRHLSHHAGSRYRPRATTGMALETGAVLALWGTLLLEAPAFFLTAYLPGYLAALLLCAIHGHFEHARGTRSHYGRLYNALFLNDGYHVEHHASPGTHWTRLPERRDPAAASSSWPAILRWLEVFNLETLERWVLRSGRLRNFVLGAHRRAFRALLPRLPPIRRVGIVGGGLFPRTALLLSELLPRARLVVIDQSAESLRVARPFLPAGVELRLARFPEASPGDFDLLVVPLSFSGDRDALYRSPPAPAVIVHDWLWRRRGKSAVVSFLLQKRLNLIERAGNPEEPVSRRAGRQGGAAVSPTEESWGDCAGRGWRPGAAATSTSLQQPGSRKHACDQRQEGPDHRRESTEERRSVEKALREAGYTVTCVGPGPKALQTATLNLPDLIILGYEYGDQLGGYVCRQLVEKSELAKVPIVLVSRRPDLMRQIQPGLKSVVDVLSRRELERVILPAVEKALGVQPAPPAAAEANGGGLGSLVEEVQRLAGPEALSALDSEAPALPKVYLALASRLREKILDGIRGGADLGREALARTLAGKVLDADFIYHLTREVCEIVDGPRKHGFTASAKLISLPDLLQSLTNRQQTGILTVSGPRNMVEIHLLSGAVCFLNPRQIQLRFCHENLHCSFSSFSLTYIAQALEKSAQEEDSIFFRMLEDKAVSADDLHGLMLSLSLEVLQECMSDTESCYFEFRPRGELGQRFLEFNANLPTQTLLLRLFTNLDEWKIIEKQISDDHVRFVASPSSGESAAENLSEKQTALLAALVKPLTILEMSAACRLSTFEVCRGLHRLLKLGLAVKAEPSQTVPEVVLASPPAAQS